jgi:hypothetical protein
LKKLYLKENENYLKADEQFRKEEEEMKGRWQRPLEDIAATNETIEEAWRDLREHEEEVRKKLDQCQDNEERDKLLAEQDELDKARELLKEEEEISSHKEKLLLDQIEKEMEKFENNKDEELGELALKRDTIVVSKDESLCRLHSALKEKKKSTQKLKREVSRCEHEVEKLKSSVQSLCDDKDIRQAEIKQRKRSLQEDMTLRKENTQLAVTDLETKVVKTEENLQEELRNIQSQRERYLFFCSFLIKICSIELKCLYQNCKFHDP